MRGLILPGTRRGNREMAIDYVAHGAVGTQVVLEASRQLLINISTRRS
jgi:hypothetical protein